MAEVKKEPNNPVTEDKKEPPTPMAEVKTEPPKPAAETKAEPPKPAAEAKTEPPKPAAETKAEPPKPTAETKTEPPKPAAEAKKAPVKPAAEAKKAPAKPAAEAKKAPAKPAAKAKTEPKKPAKKKPKKPAKPVPPPPTPEEIRAHAQLEIEGADLALDFRDQANYYRKAAALLKTIPADANSEEGPDDAAQAEEYLRKADEIQENGFRDAYTLATAAMEQATHADEYYEAATALRRISEYRDAAQLAEECEHRFHRLNHRKPTGLLLGVLVLLLVAAVVVVAQTPFGKYQRGRMYLSRARYANAIVLFSELDNYRDSQELEMESRYQQAIRHMEHGRYAKAIHHFRKLEDYQDSLYQKAVAEQEILRAAYPGTTVPFGQTDWIVLDSDGKSALLLQKEIIPEAHPYHEKADRPDWKTSGAKTWLNETYRAEAFSAVEQGLLLPQPAAEDDSAVFLLSVDEAEKYGKYLAPEEPTSAKGRKKKDVPQRENWWLRTPGTARNAVAFVSPDGKVMPFGYLPDSTEIFLRPAIRVSLIRF